MDATSVSRTIRRPLIFVPGILGSRLCDEAGNVVWGERDSLWNFSSLALPFRTDPAHLAHHPCGLVDQIQIVGPFKLHQYDQLLSHLQSLGYQQQGGALKIFTYDWRLSNFHTTELLKHFIDEAAPDPTQQVDIVTHSMGGLIARLYVQAFGGAERVRSLIMMGTPHRGAGQVFRIVEEGWGWWKNAMAGGLTAIRDSMLSFPSVYQLLPSYKNACGWREEEGSVIEGQFSAFDERVWTSFRLAARSVPDGRGQGFRCQSSGGGRTARGADEPISPAGSARSISLTASSRRAGNPTSIQKRGRSPERRPMLGMER